MHMDLRQLSITIIFGATPALGVGAQRAVSNVHVTCISALHRCELQERYIKEARKRLRNLSAGRVAISSTYRAVEMKSLLWLLSCFLVFSFVLAAPVRDVVDPNSALSNPIRSINNTHFSERDPSVPLKRQLKGIVLKSRRRLEFFGRWVWGVTFPSVRPPRDNIYLLRALEDPIFISAYEPRSAAGIYQMDSRGDSDPTSLLTTSANAIVRDILELANGLSERYSPGFSTDYTS